MSKFLFSICIACFFKAEAQKPSALAIADSLYSVDNYTEAIADYSRILPKNGNIHLKIARAHRAKGMLGDALDCCKNARSKIKSRRGLLMLEVH